MKIMFIQFAQSSMTKNQFLSFMEENYDSTKTSWSLKYYLKQWEQRFKSGYKNLIVPNRIPANLMHQCIGALSKAQVNYAQTNARNSSWVCATGYNRGKNSAQYADHMKNSVLWS